MLWGTGHYILTMRLWHSWQQGPLMERTSGFWEELIGLRGLGPST